MGRTGNEPEPVECFVGRAVGLCDAVGGQEGRMSLTAEQVSVGDYWEWMELAYERRWSDGLPLVPPTPELVEQMVAYAGRDAQEVLGAVPPRYGEASIENLAINSVMAGCKPEYFPVVLAAVEAMLEPEFNLNGVQTTTHNNEPLVIVSGPAVKQLGINAGHGVFGNGYRANGTIGRAIKLILWNLGGSYPGEPDKTTFAHPGKWSYCIGENQEESPWEPFHVERGVGAEDSAVTVFSCEAPHSIGSFGTLEQALNSLVEGIAYVGSNNYYHMGQTLLVVGPETAGILSRGGFTRSSLREYLWEKTRIDIRRLKSGYWVEEYARQTWPSWLDVDDDSAIVPPVSKPEDILVMVAGGAGKFSVLCPGWGELGGLARTKALV